MHTPEHTKDGDSMETFLMPGGKVTLGVTVCKKSGLFDLHVKRITFLEPSYVKTIVSKYSANAHGKVFSSKGLMSIDGLINTLPSAPIFSGRIS